MCPRVPSPYKRRNEGGETNTAVKSSVERQLYSSSCDACPPFLYAIQGVVDRKWGVKDLAKGTLPPTIKLGSQMWDDTTNALEYTPVKIQSIETPVYFILVRVKVSKTKIE